MKKIWMFSLLATCGHFAMAADAPRATDRVLSLAEFDAGGVKVQLAKTMASDGRVCQDYVSSIVRADDGALVLTINKICDKPAN